MTAWLVSGLRLPLTADEHALEALALGRLGVTRAEVAATEVVHAALDRRRGQTTRTFTVRVELKGTTGPATRVRRDPTVRLVTDGGVEPLRPGATVLEHPPVIIGAGPAGLFAALWLARRGLTPVVLERGDAMNARATRVAELNRDGVLDPESNYLFGEGGAGTWSDGKLTSRSKDTRARQVLEEFRDMSGVDAVMTWYRPHLGSDRIRAVVGRLRTEIIRLGGTFRFRCRALGLNASGGAVTGVRTNDGVVPAQMVVLAPGHSARAFVRDLAADGVAMEQKAFQLGLRVEHPQGLIDRAIWGSAAGTAALGPADYRLAAEVGGRSVFSFCMCPGGEVIAAVNDAGHMNTNGMSWSKRASGFANSGLVTTIEPVEFGRDDVFAGVALQEEVEARAAAAVDGSMRVPAQRLTDWLAGRPSATLPAGSCRTGMQPADLRALVPPDILKALGRSMEAFARQLKGFLDPEAVLVGPEARSSSPVRILRNRDTHESPGVAGLFPVGEGAGYAGGIVSAAVDGIRAAESILGRVRWTDVPACTPTP